MTNIERIQQLINENKTDLAWFIKRLMFNDFKPACKNSTFFSADHMPDCEEDCIDCITKWLDQEMSEEFERKF